MEEVEEFHKLSNSFFQRNARNLVAKAELSLLLTRKLHHPLKDFNTNLNINLNRKKVPSLIM